MAIVGFLALMAFSVAHAFAGFLGIQDEWGTGWAWGAIALAVVFRFTLPLSIGAFFGALNVWHWHWTLAALFAAPGLAFILPGVVAAVLQWAKSALVGSKKSPSRASSAADVVSRSLPDGQGRQEPILGAMPKLPRQDLVQPRSINEDWSALDEGERLSSYVIVSGYRHISHQAGNRIAPTVKTSDARIMEIYQMVGMAFGQAAAQRGEVIPAPYLNHIVLMFLEIEEAQGGEFLVQHLRYQTDKYLREGLRQDYRKELHLF